VENTAAFSKAVGKNFVENKNEEDDPGNISNIRRRQNFNLKKIRIWTFYENGGNQKTTQKIA
jgi:hypothetical protein